MNSKALSKDQSPTISSYTKTILSISLGAFFLIIPALLNGFPFMFPDSGGYLVFTPCLPHTPFYALFIFFFHMNHWIWGPIVAQALIASHLLWLTLAVFLSTQVHRKLIVLCFCLSLFSSLPYFVGFVMADFFTPITFLVIYLFSFHYERLSSFTKIYLFFLLCVALSSHITHVAMAIGMLPLVLLLLWKTTSRAQLLLRTAITTTPVILTVCAVLLYNVVVWNLASLTPAGSVYLMANLIQYGPAREYLTQNCPNTSYKICGEVERLPKTADEFLWSTGILDKLGGFSGMREEAQTIVRETIKTDPLSVLKIVVLNFLSGLNTRAPAAEFFSAPQVPSMPNLLETKFGSRAGASYLSSAEMQNKVPRDLLKKVDDYVFPAVSLLVLGLGILSWFKKDKDSWIISIYFISAFLGNTLLCTTFSGIHDRYQARVSWLIVFAACLLVLLQKEGKRSAETPVG